MIFNQPKIFVPIMQALAVLFVATMPVACGSSPPLEIEMPTVTLDTTLGEIVIKVDQQGAPSASAYFLDLVASDRYNGATFYRAGSLGNEADDDATPQLIQGGLLGYVVAAEAPIEIDRSSFPVLQEFETTEQTGKHHLFATVSFARDLLETGVVIPEIVICLRETPQMDAYGRSQPDSRGFPAFGEVVSGMQVVKAIAEQETRPTSYIEFLSGQILAEPITITRAYIN